MLIHDVDGKSTVYDNSTSSTGYHQTFTLSNLLGIQQRRKIRMRESFLKIIEKPFTSPHISLESFLIPPFTYNHLPSSNASPVNAHQMLSQPPCTHTYLAHSLSLSLSLSLSIPLRRQTYIFYIQLPPFPSSPFRAIICCVGSSLVPCCRIYCIVLCYT